MILTEVAPGSAAWRRGVRNFLGRKLVRIGVGGRQPAYEIRSPDDVSEALAAVEEGEVVSLYFVDNQGGQDVVNVRMPR